MGNQKEIDWYKSLSIVLLSDVTFGGNIYRGCNEQQDISYINTDPEC